MCYLFSVDKKAPLLMSIAAVYIETGVLCKNSMIFLSLVCKIFVGSRDDKISLEYDDLVKGRCMLFWQ